MDSTSEIDRMPSLESNLAAATNEVHNLRLALQEEVEERRRDHDELMGLAKGYGVVTHRIDTIEEIERERRDRRWHAWIAIGGWILSVVMAAVSLAVGLRT